jgi:hypothetical protein
MGATSGDDEELIPPSAVDHRSEWVRFPPFLPIRRYAYVWPMRMDRGVFKVLYFYRSSYDSSPMALISNEACVDTAHSIVPLSVWLPTELRGAPAYGALATDVTEPFRGDLIDDRFLG